MNIAPLLLITGNIIAVIIIILLLSKIRGITDELASVTDIVWKTVAEAPPNQSSSSSINRTINTLQVLASRLKELDSDLGWEREKITAILSTIDAGIFVLSNERQVIILNDTAQRIFKVSGDNNAGKPFINLVRDHEMDNLVQKCLETGQRQTGEIQSFGGKYYLELIVTPLSRGALVQVQDVTGVRRLEKTRQDFIANISHELRTPIASCKAIVETLQNGAIKEKNIAKDFLQRMHVEIDKLAQLVNELSELSCIESGELSLNLNLMNLNEVINQVVERLKAQADRMKVEVIVDIQTDLPDVTADKDRIEQVLVNLVHNAIKFTPPDGKIAVSSEIKGNDIWVSVKDSGIGISGDELSRIFERFYKVDKARSGGGTGLGLAIAKHIVQAHGGNIWAESEERKGSTFIFSLPIAAS